MRDMNPALLIAITVGAVVVLALLGALVQERRTRLLRQAAEDMGWSFREKDPVFAAALQGTGVLNQGQTQTVRNVLHGSAGGLDTLVCDVHYTVVYARNQQHRATTVLCFIDPSANWPILYLKPRQFFHRFVGREVNFDNDPAFAKSCLLQSDDEEATRALFNEDVRHFFAQNLTAAIEAAGPRLLYCPGRLVPPEELRPLLEEGFRVLNVLQGGGAERV
jgi:hypothetical protein